MFLTVQVRRQSLLRRCCTGRRARARRADTPNIGNATPSGQILQFGLKPLDLPVQLLGLAARLHPFQFVDLGLELFDLDITLGKLGTGLDQQGLESIDVIWKLGILGHARSLRAPQCVYNTDSTAVRRGCRQSMPSSNIDSCAWVKWILPPS